MRKIVWLLLAAVASFAAVADEDGTRLSGEELKTLVTGATVEHVTKSGSLRRWKNDADGSFMVTCLLYTSPSPRDRTRSRMPSSA